MLPERQIRATQPLLHGVTDETGSFPIVAGFRDCSAPDLPGSRTQDAREAAHSGSPGSDRGHGRTPAGERGRAGSGVGSSVPATGKSVTELHERYFEQRLRVQPVVDRIYRSLKEKLPPGEIAELAIEFIAGGPVRNSDPEFVQYMTSLHEAVRARSQELYELLRAQDGALKQDPFVYQMTLNLAFQLSLPKEQIAELLGSAMSIHFAKDGQSGVTMMSANITNAFILMKNSGVTLAQALPYIDLGMATNRDDVEAMKEFAARANAYYPGAVTAL